MNFIVLDRIAEKLTRLPLIPSWWEDQWCTGTCSSFVRNVTSDMKTNWYHSTLDRYFVIVFTTSMIDLCMTTSRHRTVRTPWGSYGTFSSIFNGTYLIDDHKSDISQLDPINGKSLRKTINHNWLNSLGSTGVHCVGSFCLFSLDKSSHHAKATLNFGSDFYPEN